jgi:hypothetical protein
MNERIRQLAEQARIKDHWSMDERRYLTNFLDEQKFAELIVRECAGVTLDYKNHDHYTGWLDYRDEIRRHFGVDE